MPKEKTAGKLPVIAAFVGNALLVFAKFFGFFITGSGAMFSESIHSLADTANQFLLFIGVEQSTKKASIEHPYGHGRERYIWALISACGIFFLGCGVTVYHGVSTLIESHKFTFNIWAVVILLISFCIESFTFWIAYREIRQRFPRAKWKTISQEADPATLALSLKMV